MDLYDETCLKCSKIITKKYSTSFSLGIKTFHKRFRYPIYAIYGFVRFADEIVDTFHDKNKQELLARFRKETFLALEEKISLNPVLQSFQKIVNEYAIDLGLIDAFLRSMEMDLDKTIYTDESYKDYIYGSAEVIGLMCLKVFSEGDEALYNSLVPKARSLGSAFQKINFLRDIKSDFDERGRTYFPLVNFLEFTEVQKQEIEKDIRADFQDALEGIKALPKGCKLGVYVAYLYYVKLFDKIRSTPAKIISEKRIRISDSQKLYLMGQAMLKDKINRI
jgi:phytoene synthase